jgi:hypothetical protein
MSRHAIGDRPMTAAERTTAYSQACRRRFQLGHRQPCRGPVGDRQTAQGERRVAQAPYGRRCHRGGQPFNIEHLRRWPAMTAPWLYEKLGDSATDTLISEIKQARALARRKAYQDPDQDQ